MVPNVKAEYTYIISSLGTVSFSLVKFRKCLSVKSCSKLTLEKKHNMVIILMKHEKVCAVNVKIIYQFTSFHFLMHSRAYNLM